MKVLVTGGAGFIGSRLVERLVRKDIGPVVALDNLFRNSWEKLRSYRGGVEIIEGDVRDRGLVSAAMKEVSVVFHLAAQSNVLGAAAELDYSFSTNVGGTFEVLRAAREAGVARVVFTSSREVYGEPERLPVSEDAPLRPKNAYGASKVAGELYARVFAGDGLPVSILRLANVYGPGDKGRVIPIFLERIARKEPLVIFGGQQVLDFIWIETVMDALLAAAFGELPDGPVNVGSGEGVTLQRLAERIAACADSQVEIRIDPARSIETTRFVADVTRMRQKLGINPGPDALAWLPMLQGETVQA